MQGRDRDFAVAGDAGMQGRDRGIAAAGAQGWAPGLEQLPARGRAGAGVLAVLTAPVRSSRPVKGWGLAEAGGYAACRATTKTRRMRSEMMLNIMSILRKRK